MGLSEEVFRFYFEVVKVGMLKLSVGVGIGIERLVRYIVGVKYIVEV